MKNFKTLRTSKHYKFKQCIITMTVKIILQILNMYFGFEADTTDVQQCLKKQDSSAVTVNECGKKYGADL
jgi:hypothetical protein